MPDEYVMFALRVFTQCFYTKAPAELQQNQIGIHDLALSRMIGFGSLNLV